MIDPDPRWGYSPGTGLTAAQESVLLVDECVLGQWWCLERNTGRVRWELHDLEPTSVVGVGERVLVATELVSKGPTTGTFGTWAYSLDTGEELWKSEGVGLLTLFWMLLRGRGDELETSPIGVRDGECATENGNILDVHTGRVLRREQELSRFRSEYAMQPWELGRVTLSGDDWLFIDNDQAENRVVLRRESLDGRTRWDFDSGQHEGCFERRSGRIRLQGDFVYMMVTDAPFDETQPVARRWSLCTLDLCSGVVVQRLELARSDASPHRIEDADGQLLLWSRGNEHLSAHALQSG